MRCSWRWGGLLFGALTWALWGDFAAARRGGDYFGTMGIFTLPTWPFKFLTFVGSAALTVQFLLEVADVVRGLPRMLARGRGRYLTLVLAGIAVFAVAVLVVATGDLGRVTLGILSIVFLLVLATRPQGLFGRA